MEDVHKEYGYARVSSQKQHEDRQIDALLSYGIGERDIIVDKSSGKDFERKGYELLKYSLLRTGDVLVIKEMDRLGRSKQGVKDELEYFRGKGIRVKILDIPTTLVEADGQGWIIDMVSNIMIEVLASIGEEERHKIKRRQREGIDAAISRGVRFGRPRLEKPEKYEEVMSKVSSGAVSATEAMQMLGLKRGTYYNMRKLYQIGVKGYE
ncbi:MAG: recombinase family protein [Eubacterium sp.]|nr:recombinase family protein [Eubacterium sp.]